jgi:hypothetical protein
MLDGIAPTRPQIKFLNSFSEGREDETNARMCEQETLYLSDSGGFCFSLGEVDRQEDCDILTGVMHIGDQCAMGRILVFKNMHIAVDFVFGEKEILESIPGREEDLDKFVEEVYVEVVGKK